MLRERACRLYLSRQRLARAELSDLLAQLAERLALPLVVLLNTRTQLIELQLQRSRTLLDHVQAPAREHHHHEQNDRNKCQIQA
jgi:hypothetical protein